MSRASAGGQLEHPSEVNNSTTTGVCAKANEDNATAPKNTSRRTSFFIVRIRFVARGFVSGYAISPRIELPSSQAHRGGKLSVAFPILRPQRRTRYGRPARCA